MSREDDIKMQLLKEVMHYTWELTPQQIVENVKYLLDELFN